MTNTIAVTNLVLSLILPKCNELASRLNLDVPVPISTADVTRVVLIPDDESKGEIITRSGDHFLFADARVYGFTLATVYFSRQETASIDALQGTATLTQMECERAAKRALDVVGAGQVIGTLPPTRRTLVTGLPREAA